MGPMDQHPPHLMAPAPPQVLFFGEFRPKEGGEVDEVSADRPQRRKIPGQQHSRDTKGDKQTTDDE